MDKEIQEYLENTSKLLNSQIRGAINQKAREENLELIQLTLLDTFKQGIELGQQKIRSDEEIQKLKNIINEESEDN